MSEQRRQSMSGSADFTTPRRAGLRERLRDKKLKAILVSRAENVRYLSGFSGEDSWLLVAEDEAVLITDGRFAEQAEKECAGLTLLIRRGPLAKAACAALRKRGVKRCAVEAAHLSVAGLKSLSRATRKCSFVPTESIVEGLRQVKDSQEVEAIRSALDIAQTSWIETLKKALKLRRKERDIAGFLEYNMRMNGASRAAFETICAIDENASMPHARAGAKALGGKSCVLFDWGACFQGYNSDLTRVVALDKMPPRIREIYRIVLRAQQKAIAAVGPGVECREVDRAARSYIESKGYGKAFGHGTGHGVGLNIHEAPGVSAGNPKKLESGMVITIEPGIYLPDVGGIRIEDMVLVTDTGHRVLSTLPKKLPAMELLKENTLWT